MSDKFVSVGNGRVVFGIKEVMIVSGLIFTAGGGWWLLNAHGAELVRLEQQITDVDQSAEADHETVVKMGKDIERLVDDLRMIKQQQTKMSESSQRQELMLQQLLSVAVQAEAVGRMAR